MVNGGSFGQRFAEICAIHGIPYTEIKVEMGKTITEDMLGEYSGRGYTGFLVIFMKLQLEYIMTHG